MSNYEQLWAIYSLWSLRCVFDCLSLDVLEDFMALIMSSDRLNFNRSVCVKAGLTELSGFSTTRKRNMWSLILFCGNEIFARWETEFWMTFCMTMKEQQLSMLIFPYFWDAADSILLSHIDPTSPISNQSNTCTTSIASAASAPQDQGGRVCVQFATDCRCRHRLWRGLNVFEQGLHWIYFKHT